MSVLLVEVVLTCAIMWIRDWGLRDSALAAFGLLCAVTFIVNCGAWLGSKSQAGRLLLDCGEHPGKRLFLFQAGFCSLLTVGAMFAEFVGDFNKLYVGLGVVVGCPAAS